MPGYHAETINQALDFVSTVKTGARNKATCVMSIRVCVCVLYRGGRAETYTAVSGLRQGSRSEQEPQRQRRGGWRSFQL